MTETQDIFANLEQARGAIARAGAEFDANGALDLRQIEHMVDLAAAGATHAPAEVRSKARIALINLAADLTDLQTRIRKESQRTAEFLGRTAVNRRAVVAYNRRG